MKLLNHIAPSASAIIAGTVRPHIASTTAAYRQALDEHYAKDHEVVNARLQGIATARLEKQR